MQTTPTPRGTRTPASVAWPSTSHSYIAVSSLLVYVSCASVRTLLADRRQYDGSLLNGLQTVPKWQKDFDSPTGNILGLIAASFYLRMYSIWGRLLCD
jgi:hypothetical protein